MQSNTTGVRYFPCSQALGAYLRVKTDPTYGLALAGVSDEEIGTLYQAFAASGLGSGSNASVVMPSAPGTVKMVAAGPIAQFADVYAAANGKVDDTGTVRLGKNVGVAATADGDYIEVLRYQSTQTADTGTTASTWTVDSDSSAAKLKLDTNSATGDYTLSLVPANLTGDRTLTLPNATDTLVGKTTTDTLTNKTLTAPTITLAKRAVNNTPVAAAGSDQSGAAAVGAQDTVTISSDSTAKGVKLLTGAAGQVITIINTTATACKLYPAGAGSISGEANVTLAASHVVQCHCVAADTWYAVDLGAVLAA